MAYPGSDGCVVNGFAGHPSGVGDGKLWRSIVMFGALQWLLVEQQLGFLGRLAAFFSGRHQYMNEEWLVTTLCWL